MNVGRRRYFCSFFMFSIVINTYYVNTAYIVYIVCMCIIYKIYVRSEKEAPRAWLRNCSTTCASVHRSIFFGRRRCLILLPSDLSPQRLPFFYSFLHHFFFFFLSFFPPFCTLLSAHNLTTHMLGLSAARKASVLCVIRGVG